MSSNAKKVLVMGGGTWQVPIIRFLKSKGLFVAATDLNPNCPAAAVVDQFINVSGKDVDGVLARFKKSDFDYVTTDQSDLTIEAAAKLATTWGLTANEPKAVQNFTDKAKCRELAAKLDIPQPAFRAATDVAQVREFVTSRPGKCILKPADSMSSRGVAVVDAKTNLEEVVKAALPHSPRKKVIVEDFMKGKEITVEGICSGGKHRVLAISLKDHFRTALANRLHYPAQLPGNIETEICAALDRFVENSGLKFGITHAEVMVDFETKTFGLVEYACRGGGTMISSHITPWVSGVDLYEILWGDLNGHPTDVKSLQLKRRGALLGFFEFESGHVKKITGLEEARRVPGVQSIELEFKVGDEIKDAADDRGRQGFGIVFGEDAKAADELWEKVKRTIQVEVQ